MNVVNFAEEFTQLLARWTSPSVQNGILEENAITPLTNEQVLVTVQDVLRVLLGINMQAADYSSVTTPASGIEICTPTAPMATRPGELTRFRSLDTLTMPQSNGSKNSGMENFVSKSEDQMDVENDAAEALPEGKKFVSRSSPAIHVTSLGRQDTFIREEEEKALQECDKSAGNFEPADKIDFDTFDDFEKTMPREFLQKLELLRDCAFEVVSRIDDVKKQSFSQNTKPIRRLSSIGGFGGLGRSSTMLRSIPPPKVRRSSTAFPGTPTSSKLNNLLTVEKSAITTRRKSIGGAALHLSTAAKMSPASPRSSLVLSANKKSPLSAGRPAKNPKYAHVQSTIPKSSVGKRKAP